MKLSLENVLYLKINHEIYKNELENETNESYDLKSLLISLKNIEGLEFSCKAEQMDRYINDTETPYLIFIQPSDNLSYDIVKKTDGIKDDYKSFVAGVQNYCPYMTDLSQPDCPWTRALTIANNKVENIRWVSHLHKTYNFGYPISYDK